MKKFNVSKLSYINPKIRLRKTEKKGKGLFAVKNIKKGEILTISAGIGVPQKMIKKLPKGLRSYCFYIENGWFYCPFGNSRLSADWFLNHSCRPNAGGVRNAFTIKALKNIKADEEITYDYSEDYKFWRYQPLRRFKCRCGAENCRKIIRY